MIIMRVGMVKLKVVKGEVEMMRVGKEKLKVVKEKEGMAKLKVGARGGEEMKVEMVVYDVV
jgi:hypothetical protein